MIANETFSGPEALARAMSGGKVRWRDWDDGVYLFYNVSAGYQTANLNGEEYELNEYTVGSMANDIGGWTDYTLPEPRFRMRKGLSFESRRKGDSTMNVMRSDGERRQIFCADIDFLFERVEEGEQS